MFYKTYYHTIKELVTKMDSSGNYPSDWDQRRRRVYKRDEYVCQNCGSVGGTEGNTELHAHHIVPVSQGGHHKISNLVCLCSACHSLVHGHPIGRAAHKTNKLADRKPEKSGVEKESLKIEDVEESCLNLAGQTTEAIGHLSRFILSLVEEKNPDMEELGSFSISTKLALVQLMVADNLFTEYYDNAEGWDGFIRAYGNSHKPAKKVSNADLIDTCRGTISELMEIQDIIDDYINNQNQYSDQKFADEITDSFDSIQQDMSMVVFGIVRSILASENSTKHHIDKETIINEWTYCPVCGVLFGVYNSGDNKRECLLCQAKWKKKGWIKKKWSCTDVPDIANLNKKRCDLEEWKRQGVKSNNAKVYESINDIQRTEIARLGSYASKFLVDNEKE